MTGQETRALQIFFNSSLTGDLGARGSGRRTSASTADEESDDLKSWHLAPLTSVAILSLMEEGRLTPNMPVSRFIPAYAHTTVAVKGDAGPSTVPARACDYVCQSLTHTAGISYGTDSLGAAQYEAIARGASIAWTFCRITAEGYPFTLMHDSAPKRSPQVNPAPRATGARSRIPASGYRELPTSTQ